MVGIPILVVASAFIVYAFIGAEKSLTSIIYNLFYTPQQDDIVVFHLTQPEDGLQKAVVKRVIAKPADMVSINNDGTVYVNGHRLVEPYVQDKALGECDLDFPYQVPDSRYFLMGDHRQTSVDSRSSVVGCVAEEQIVGKVVFCVWPLSDFGTLN